MNPLVVIDTNVWISGLFWKGIVFQIMELVYDGRLTSCFSLETFSEWDEKVRLWANVTNQVGLYFQYKKYLHKHGLFFTPTEKIDICRDPSDNKFLEVAFSAKADFLITGDRDLLAVKKYKNIKIVSPKEFLQKFIEEKRNNFPPIKNSSK